MNHDKIKFFSFQQELNNVVDFRTQVLGKVAPVIYTKLASLGIKLPYKSVPEFIAAEKEEISVINNKGYNLFKETRALFLTKQMSIKTMKPADSNTVLDLPFKNVWLEYLTDQALAHVRNTMLTNELLNKIEFSAIMVNEIEPGSYEFLTINGCDTDDANLYKIVDNKGLSTETKHAALYQGLKKGIIYIDKSHPLYLNLVSIVQWILKELSSQDIGDVAINKTISHKGRNGIKNRLHIKNIVVCGNKKQAEEISLRELGKPIHWSHAWEVRGHWRKCSGIGKDREDLYQVKNFTWVKEHKKGDGKLIIKQRIFGFLGNKLKQEEANAT